MLSSFWTLQANLQTDDKIMIST